MTRDHALLYDRDCGLCTWVVDVLLRWDRSRRLRPVALQDPEAARLLPGLTPAERMASFHLVGPDGAVASAGEALPPLMGLLPAGAPLKRLFGASPALTERGYRWVADHRSALGKLISGGARARADRRIAARS